MVDAVWGEARRQLRGRLLAKDFEVWIALLRAGSWNEGVLTLEGGSPFVIEWVKERYLGDINAVLRDIAGEEARARLVVNRSLVAPEPPRRPLLRATEPAPVADVAASRFTFDSFIVGESNRVAYEAARAVVECPGTRFNPLFIYGGVGLGKTHLLSAVANGVERRWRRGTVAYLTAENFVNEMIAALRTHAMDRFRERFRGVGTLIVDDVQFLGGKKRSQQEFTHTFNALHDGRKQIVVASDRPPAELPGIEEALRARFASGLLADIQPPGRTLRLALARRKAIEAGLDLAEDGLAFVADRWCDNGRQLEGVLTRIAAFVGAGSGCVTLVRVREALRPYEAPASGQRTVGRIVHEVCRQYGLTRSEIASASRTARVAVPRQVAMYLCRQHTDAALGAIGEELGGRNHSTVVHALAAVERRLRSDAALRQVVAAVEARLAG